ncbi:MAG: metallophosphoesterase [Actinobacteria bacterium]|nr:metallophosphoesterase [Actinomycetota bacterium]
MGACCHLSRRQLLQWAALVAASPLLGALNDADRAYGLTRGQTAGPTVALNLELVTLTETTVVLTWVTGDPTRLDSAGRPAPVPADTELLLGTSPASLKTVLHDSHATPYHYAEITGLEPGQTYFFVAQSDGVPAVPAASSFGSPLGDSFFRSVPQGPFSFTTPQPPPGKLLFAIALCNDMHLGETVAGLATTQAGVQIPPGITQSPGLPPYPQVMAAALGPEAHQRGANLLLAAGDISSEAASLDVNKAKAYLDAYGTYQQDYFVTRGNHDRPHTGAAAGTCRAVHGANGYHDCFADAFFPSGPTWFERNVFGMRLLGLDTYDKIGSGGDNGVMSAQQFAFVRDVLAKDKDQPTLVIGHHPVTLEATLTTTEPVIFDMQPQQAMQLEQLYAATPGVFLHHAGHTHRNKRTISAAASGVVFQEVAAVKEYPGGFHLLRVFTGGYALNFYKFRNALAQEWSERSRPEYGGLAPFYTFGNHADRNSVVLRDFSGLQPATAAPRVGGTSASNGGAPHANAGGGAHALPPTGTDDRRALLASAALAAGLAAEHWLTAARRH